MAQKSRGKKLALLAGELAAAYLIISLMMIVAMATVGSPTGVQVIRVDAIVAGSAADGLLLPGDEITHVGGTSAMIRRNGQHTNRVSELLQSPEPIDVRIIRQKKMMTVEILPRLEPGASSYRVGIALTHHREIRKDIRLSAAFQVPIIEAKLVVGRIRNFVLPRTQGEFRGPVGIADLKTLSRRPLGIYPGILYTGRIFLFLLILNFVCLLLPVRNR